MFNEFLRQSGVDPVDVRLIRHQDPPAKKDRTPYKLLKQDPNKFEGYQSIQNPIKRKTLQASYWASFVCTPDKDVMFVGLYEAEYEGPNQEGTPCYFSDEVCRADAIDSYT